MLPANQQSTLAFDEDDAAMGKRYLRHQQDLCREHLQTLERAVNLCQVATIQQLCEALAVQRQRPIYLEAFNLPPSVYGVCVNTATTDYIFYAADAAPPLQEHIVLHEVAHVLLGLPEVRDHLLLDLWLRNREADAPDAPLPSAVLDAALKRTCYDEESECLAELLATLIEQRWRTLRQRNSDQAPHLWGAPDLRWLSEQAGDVG